MEEQKVQGGVEFCGEMAGGARARLLCVDSGPGWGNRTQCDMDKGSGSLLVWALGVGRALRGSWNLEPGRVGEGIG